VCLNTLNNRVNSICLAWFSSLLCCISCNSSDPQQDAIARVYDSYLPRSEVVKQIPYGISAKDSAAIADEYINSWIYKKVVLKKAELNLTDEQKDVNRQLDDYRTSLLRFAYEKELVRQKLDTVVSDSEIEAFYAENGSNFELKNNIIRIRYLKIQLDAPNQDRAFKWFKSSDAADQNKLIQYSQLYAVTSLLDDTNWLLLEDVIKEVPLTDYSHEKFNRNIRMLDLSDKEYRYFVQVTGFLIKDSKAPLSFERTNIRNIILNKRRIQLVRQMQEDAYQDATNSKNIELYGK